jgi:hypothetical protein
MLQISLGEEGMPRIEKSHPLNQQHLLIIDYDRYMKYQNTTLQTICMLTIESKRRFSSLRHRKLSRLWLSSLGPLVLSHRTF